VPIHYEFDGWQDAAPVAALSFGRCGHVSDIRIITMIHVFWTLFITMAGLVLARVVDPVTAQHVIGMITRMGGEVENFIEFRLFLV
jgi:hypothetical protein